MATKYDFLILIDSSTGQVVFYLQIGIRIKLMAGMISFDGVHKLITVFALTSSLQIRFEQVHLALQILGGFAKGAFVASRTVARVSCLIVWVLAHDSLLKEFIFSQI